VSTALHERICDWTQCPRCVAENEALGGGTGYADSYFNAGGALWAVCAVHDVRWYVTHALFCLSIHSVRDRPGEPLLGLPVVAAIYRWRSGKI
jgi:hypothetical protein